MSGAAALNEQPTTVLSAVATETIGAALLRGARKGIGTFWLLTKIMAPIYIAIAVLDRTPVLHALAEWMSPAMTWWHLPGDAALALVLGMVVNLYAAVAVIAYGSWTPIQVTIISVILGISHSLVMEGAIVRKMGLSPGWFVPVRLTCGLTVGWLVASLYYF